MTSLLVGLAAVLAVAGAIRGTVFSGLQERRLRWRCRCRLRPGPGFASWPELVFRWGRLSALHHGKRARPSMSLPERLITPATAYAIRLGRGPAGRRCYARTEDHTLVYSAPRTYKTAAMADRVICHPGAAVVNETRPDIYELTSGYRAGLGDVHLFNPERVAGYPCTFGWQMIDGCEDAGEAMRRAADLVGAVAAQGEMAWWSEKGATALAAGMYSAGAIAAVSRPLAAGLRSASVLGATMDDVWTWVNAPSAGARLVQEARRALNGNGNGDGEALFAALTELDKSGKTADSIKITMGKSLAWMGIPALRDMVTGPAARPFDVGRFVASRGTVYMLARGGDGAPGAPLYRCFAGYLHRQAGLLSQLEPGRRWDPGLLFMLDELHSCPVDAPAWLADSAAWGCQIALVVHSTGQLKEKYGPDGTETIMSATGTKMFFPGIHDPRVLRDVSELCGHLPGDAGDGKQDWVAPTEFIQRMPDRRALVIRSNLHPVVVKVRPAWSRLAFRLRQAPGVALPAMPPLTAERAEAEIADLAARLPETATADGAPIGDAVD